MDYGNEDGNGGRCHWLGGEYVLQKNPNYDASPCVWNEVQLNEEDLSYVFDETTPVKACGDLPYYVNHNDKSTTDPGEYRETSSQVKRRRMLQFDTKTADSVPCNEEMSSEFLKSNEGEDSLDEVLPQAQPFPEFSDVSASSYGVLDKASEDWLAECFNDADMNFDPDDMNFSGSSDIQIDISEFCHQPPESEANVVQKRVIRTPNVIFKGRKSFLRTPTKLPSSVAYPFAFIKPCGFQGDITLKDINQRIQTPPPSKSKQNDLASFPTSAFSGKPVVGKTKIRTEGGKGSITIMRTKG